MARDARIELDWADGTYAFRLGWGQLAELQEKCDAGPYVVLNRLHSGQWRIEDISNVIRLGLIGGGMLPADALKKVRAYVEDRPPFENIITAQVVLGAGLTGAPEEKLGEPAAANPAESELTTSPTES
ncbi:gene transfer agent family protein [Mesorhizobium sp. BR1-1-12]|uniref:gene transfer agent family protein n=1 Tax=Mesorhizobium sp. BR1-1-12 TaxID=2876657 RepID=UPI001CD18F14|nr:gene transfer agent family protein [Mesorhizobium sp. BR1-1-12]MBZ9973511.1 gene transfer agent family protein [Mesorhizobium sp. BR1-1-12]